MGVGPYLEILKEYDTVLGYEYNRIVDALTNNRPLASVNMAQCYDICFGYQPVDSVFKARCRFHLHTSIDTVITVGLHLTLQPFHVGNQTTASTTTTAANTAPAAPHFHTWVAPAGTVSSSIGPNAGGSVVSGSGSPAGFRTATEASDGSTHFSVSTGIDAAGAGHTHAIPSLTVNSANLNPPTAIYEAGMAQGVHVFVDGTDVTSTLGGPFGTGTAIDVTDLNISQFVSTTGWHEIQLSSTSIGGITTQIRMSTLLNGSM